MKKSTLRRLMVLALCLTLVTCTLVGGTLAKYTTTVTSSDTARVAKWGFTQESIDLTGLFATAYTGDGGMKAAADAIAPGTTNSATFAFTYGGETGINAPEVAYEFKVDTTGSSCDNLIKNNTNIKWYLDNKLAPAITGENAITEGSWDALMVAIKTLSGDASGTKTYGPNTLPEAFKSTGENEHTIKWEWDIGTTDEHNETDTTMGNATELDDVKIAITITATQVDTYTAPATN